MTLWLSYWWCDHCGVAVDKEHATIVATHSLAGGGCGKRLTERFNSTEPPEDDELTRVTAERDALAAENARLKVLAVNGEFYKDAETGQIYMANFHLLSKEEGRRRLAARGATFASEDAFLNASPDEAARALAGVEHLRVALDLAISLIEDCQRDLTTYLRPDGGLTKGDVISILLGRLDGPQWRAAAAARALVEAPR